VLQYPQEDTEVNEFDTLDAAEKWATEFQGSVDAGAIEGGISHVYDVRQKLTVKRVEVATVVKLQEEQPPE
jgi:hypothetical protein